MVSVSVIVPMYNVDQYIEEALNSLHLQTFLDVEFICVDDGSTDNTLAIAREFSNMDGRFKILVQENGGPAKARNVGIDISSGKYICFMDSDDFLEPDAIQIMFDSAEMAECDILVHSANIVNMGDEHIDPWILNEIDVKNKKISEFTLYDLYNENGCKPFLWQHFIKASIIKDNGLRMNESLSIGEDQAFEIQYFLASKKVLFTDQKLYNYRVHRKGSIMEKYSSKLMDKMWQHVEMVRYISSFCIPNNSDEEMCLIEWALDLMYWDLMKLLYYDQSHYAIEIMDVLDKWDVCNNSKYMSKSYYFKYMVIRDIAECLDNREELLERTMKLCSEIKTQISKTESKLLYRIGKKLIG